MQAFIGPKRSRTLGDVDFSIATQIYQKRPKLVLKTADPDEGLYAGPDLPLVGYSLRATTGRRTTHQD